MRSFYVKLYSIIIISCLGIIVYSNSYYCSFHLDDFPSIVNNPYIKNIHHWHNIWYFLPRRFILYFSFALNYHFNGLNVFGYHLFNLAVHLGSAILVWWLTLLTLATPAMKGDKITQDADLIALLTGLVFVAHPVQTEAVTYIVQRAASMATLFYLASLCLYVKSRLLQGGVIASEAKQSLKEQQILLRLPRRLRLLAMTTYIGSLIFAVMAMFTKEIAVTLPLMILLYEFTFFRTKQGLDWKRLFPFLLTIIIIPITMLFTETGITRVQQLYSEPAISSMHYLLTQFRVIVTYIRLAFLPFDQNLDYDYPISKTIFDPSVLISFLFLITVLVLAKRLFPKYRLVSFSIFWFFLALLLESSLFPIRDVIFEHRLYLPLAGYSLLLVSSAYYLGGRKSFTVTAIGLTMMIGCYSFLTYERNKVWKDEFTLWNDTVQRSPHKARPYITRGLAYYCQGKYDQAVLDYNKAIVLNPDDLKNAYYGRGLAYYRQGNFSKAISDYDQAIELDPKYEDAYYNRGNAYYKQGNYVAAIADYKKAIALNPHDADAHHNLALSNSQLKK